MDIKISCSTRSIGSGTPVGTFPVTGALVDEVMNMTAPERLQSSRNKNKFHNIYQMAVSNPFIRLSDWEVLA
jgi:hypothetical protein